MFPGTGVQAWKGHTVAASHAPHSHGTQSKANNEMIDNMWMDYLRQGSHVLTKHRILAFVMLAPVLLSAKLLLCKLEAGMTLLPAHLQLE